MNRQQLLAAIVFFPILAWGARDSGLPGAFLDVGAGARPVGLGRAFTGVADDVDSLSWNPAGMATYRSCQVEFQQTPFVGGGSSQFFAYSQPVYGWGGLGVGVVNLQSGSIPRLIDPGNAEIGSFSNRQTGYLLGYGHHVSQNLGLGTTFKIAENVMDGHAERGFGADLGGLYRLTERARIGVALRNAWAPVYRFATETERFPTLLRAGGSYLFFDQRLLTAFDVEKTLGVSQNPRWHLGAEGTVFGNVFLRGGVDASQISTGVGLRWKTLQLDYAASFQTVGLSHTVSLRSYFGGYEVDVKASPSIFSPVGLKKETVFKISAANRRRVTHWILAIRNGQGEVLRSFQGYDVPPKSLSWDGRDAQNQLAPPGIYSYRMSFTDNKNRTEFTPTRTLEIRSPTPLEIEAK